VGCATQSNPYIQQYDGEILLDGKELIKVEITAPRSNKEEYFGATQIYYTYSFYFSPDEP
jgi:hypothetical protein